MTDKDRFYVYLHRFGNGTLYVGKGTRSRYRQFSKGRHNIYWDRLLSKYGPPKTRILKRSLSSFDALSLEMEVIKKLKANGKMICNRTDGGLGGHGLEVSEETRKKLSEASLRNPPMKGKKHTQKAKDAVSRANKGRYVGRKSARYKEEVFSFINDRTGESANCTQYDLCAKHGLPQPLCSRLISGDVKSAHGWRLKETSKESTGKRKGRSHPRFDGTIYKFEHDSGLYEESTKYDLYTKYELPYPSNLQAVCVGKIKSYKGWRCLGVV